MLLEWYKIDATGIMATNSERKKPHKHARVLAAPQALSLKNSWEFRSPGEQNFKKEISFLNFSSK